MIWIVLKAETDTCVRLLGANTVNELGPRFVSVLAAWATSRVEMRTANMCSDKLARGGKGHLRRTERFGRLKAVDKVEVVTAKPGDLLRTLASVTSLTPTPLPLDISI